jgi:two-component system LytT family response regulator
LEKALLAKIRALIVDDEPVARRGIRLSLQGEKDVAIIGECGDGLEALAAIREQQPDLVFLDVQMPLLDGFGVVEALGSEHLPAIVFVTAYDEHAIRAFEAGALDYLLKPFERERFQKTLARVRRRILNPDSDDFNRRLDALLQSFTAGRRTGDQSRPLERIAIKEAGRIFFIGVSEIDWIEAQGNYLKLHAGGQSHLLRETMDGIEGKLDATRFLRIRRSTLVRIERIKELQPLFNGEYTIVLQDNTRLSSSRRYRKNLDSLLKP